MRAWGADAAPDSSDGGKILVLPFAAVNPSQYQQWLGRSIQQSLAADLTASSPGRIASADTEAADTAAALDAGRKAGAAYVVQGTFTTVGQSLRLTGQLLDVKSSQTVTGLKATGSVNDIFRMEDQIAMQVRHGLNPSAGPAEAPVAEQPPQGNYGPLAVPQQPPDQYVQTYVTPPSYGSPYDYDYYYGNPYAYGGPDYGFGWPGWYGGVIITRGFGFHRGFGGFRGGFHGGFRGGFGHSFGGHGGMGGHGGGHR